MTWSGGVRSLIPEILALTRTGVSQAFPMVVVILIVGVVYIGHVEAQSKADTAAKSPTDPLLLKIGQTVKGEQFEVVVTSFNVVPSIPTHYGPALAGEGMAYAVLAVTAKCIDSESRQYYPGSLLIENEGKLLKYDKQEIIFGVHGVTGQLNPLTHESGFIVFKIPMALSGNMMAWHPGRGFKDVHFALSGPPRSAATSSQQKGAQTPSSIEIVGAFSVERAMELIYGNYNRADKTSLWADIGPQEKLKDSNFADSKGLVAAEFSESYKENGLEKVVLVTKVVPAEEEYVCHACEPIMGLFSFVKTGTTWHVEAQNKFLGTIGSYGKIPKPQLIRIGTDKFGLMLDNSNSHMGHSHTCRYIYSISNGVISSIFHKDISESEFEYIDDNDEPIVKWSYETKFEFINGNNPKYFDIMETKIGKERKEDGNIASVNAVTLYSFDGSKYQPKNQDSASTAQAATPSQNSSASSQNNTEQVAQRSSDGQRIGQVQVQKAYPQHLAPIQQITLDYKSDATPLVIEMMNQARNEDKLVLFRGQLERLAKPQKGDKARARKLNDEGIALMRQSKDLEAVAVLETAHHADPSDVEISNNLASVYFNTSFDNNDFSKAKAMLVETLRLKPDRNIAWSNFGRIFAIEGNEFAAINCYINFWRFSANRGKASQYLTQGSKDPNPGISKACLDAYNYVSTAAPANPSATDGVKEPQKPK
jgi:Flp pilus assembly protein TadD